MALCILPQAADAALSRTDLFEGKASDGGASTLGYTTSSFTPPDNSLMVVSVGVINNAAFTQPVTISDTGGHAWTLRATATSTEQTYEWVNRIYTAPVTTGSSITVTVSSTQTTTDAYLFVNAVAYTGYNVASPIGGVAQSDAIADPAGTMTLSAAPTASDATLASRYAVPNGGDDPSATSGAGWTELYDSPQDTGGYGNLHVQERIASTSATVTWTDAFTETSDQVFGTITGTAVVIKAAAAAPASGALSKPPNNLGLVGYWSFNEGTGTVATDFSVRGNPATLNGNTTWTDGKRGRAITLDGNDDYAEVGDKTLVDGATQMSVCGWMKYSPASVTADSVFAGEFSNSGGSWVMLVDDVAQNSGRTDTIAWVVDPSQGTSGRVEGSTSLVTPNQWDHYCGTFLGGSFIRLYKNGVLDQEATTAIVATVPNVSLPIRFGATSDAQRDLNAALDEIRIYNRALTGTEVAALARAGAVKFGASSADLDAGSSLESGLIGHWTFDGKDVSGTTVSDRSGNGNDGDIVLGTGGAIEKAIGKLGQALAFTGDWSTSVETPTASISGSIAIAAWIYPIGESSNIIRKGFEYGVEVRDVAGNLFILWQDSGDGAACGAAYGEWNHIVVVQDGADVTYFRNGEACASETQDAITNTSDGFYLGGGNDAGGTRLDDVRLYGRALTAAEVKQLYNLGVVKIRQ